MPLRLPSLRGAPAVLLLALAAVAGCRGCGGRSRAPATSAAPIAVAATPAELATLDLPELKGESGEPAEVEGFVNASGTGGAFVVRTSKGARVVHGRTVSPPYPNVERVVISPDGRTVAVVAHDPDGKARVVLDGRPGQAFDAVEQPTFSRAGRFAFAAAAAGRLRVVVDGVPGPEQGSITDLRPDGSGAAFVAVEQAAPERPFEVARYGEGAERKVLREIDAAEVTLSPDGRKAAAVLGAPGGKRVALFDLVRGERISEGRSYADILALAFDPTGEHHYYAAVQGDAVLLVLDSKAEALPETELADVPVVTPQGAAGVILAGQALRFHVVFGRTPKAPRPYEGLSEVTASPDGSRWAYVADEKGRGRVVVDGQEGPVFDRVVTPRFSPDGVFLVYRARQEGKRFVVVAAADGKVLQQHPAYEQVFRPEFTADGAVAYAVKDGPRLLWKVEKLPPAP